MAILVEQTLNEINYAGGINTNKPITVGGSANVDMSASSGTFLTPTGAITLGGNITISSGKTVTGYAPNLISGSGTTVALTSAQSGSIVLFDKATGGQQFTLPAPTVGLTYIFLNTVTVTSGTVGFICATKASQGLLGGVLEAVDTGTSLFFAGNGTTHNATSLNGSTTGGLKGGSLTVTCVSTSTWLVSGMLSATGGVATPFVAG